MAGEINAAALASSVCCYSRRARHQKTSQEPTCSRNNLLVLQCSMHVTHALCVVPTTAVARASTQCAQRAQLCMLLTQRNTVSSHTGPAPPSTELLLSRLVSLLSCYGGSSRQAFQGWGSLAPLLWAWSAIAGPNPWTSAAAGRFQHSLCRPCWMF